MKIEGNSVKRGLSGWAACLLLCGGLSSVRTPAANQWPFVPNVVDQFNALSVRPDPLAFDIGDSPDPTLCRHYEGIVRVNAADGTPYFYLTRSGLRPKGVPICFGDHDPGDLVIARMGSRDTNGERLRSNRLARGLDLTDTPSDPDCYSSDCLQDVVVRHFTFDGAGEWPRYGHPEGMQLVGDILVVGVDSPLPPETQPMQVLFLHVADPENPQILHSFSPTEEGVNGGIIAMTPLSNGRYLLLVTGASNLETDVFNEKMWFYESLPTDGTADGPTDITSPDVAWVLKDIWDSTLPADKEHLGQSWPTDKGKEHQNYNFLRDGDASGTLYLAGARGGLNLVDIIRLGDDILDLYRVDFVGSDIRLQLVSSKKKHSNPNAEPGLRSTGIGSATPGRDVANFSAASSFYVSPSGELIFYASEHQNTGPAGTVTLGEWRHTDMVRPNSPTLLPSAKLFGPFSVPEGGQTTLSGQGQAPITKPWIQLWSDDTFGGRYVVIDYPDWHKDDFHDFRQLEGSPLDLHRGFNDEASSWRWFAPVTATVRANQNHIGDSPFPGEHTRTLHGTGAPEKDADLKDVNPDPSGSGNMNDEVTSVQFLADCDAYYGATPDLFWDMNLDGTFSGQGNLVQFSAAELDGPSEVDLPVKAVHPHDNLAGYTTALVYVYNLPPVITAWGVFNSLDQQLGAEVPFFLEKLPVTVRSTFTDPGKPDRQSAGILWGDGAVDQNPVFDSFSDAFGGVTGQLSHHHQYSQPGEYNLVLVVMDDDGDSAAETTVVPVLSIPDALDRIIQLLHGLIAGSTNQDVLRALQSARRSLEGAVPPVSQDGARNQLTPPEITAAIVKVGLALVSLAQADAAGADVALLTALLEQVLAALRAS